MKRTVFLMGILLLTAPFSGCLAGDSQTAKTTTATMEDKCIQTLGYYGHNIEDFWEPDTIYVAFTAPEGIQNILVVKENGTVLGTEPVRTLPARGDDGDSSSIADGYSIPLKNQLFGQHQITTYVYIDENMNGVFDPEIDTQCLKNSTPVHSDIINVNFSNMY